VTAATITPEEVERLAAMSREAGAGHQPPRYTPALPPPPNSTTNGAAAPDPAGSAAALLSPLLKQRHVVRPPVQHVWGYGPLPEDFRPADVGVFRHPLLQTYTLSVFCKLPIVPMSDTDQLRQMFIMRILLSTFQFRVSKR
jgi:hypothetical protein